MRSKHFSLFFKKKGKEMQLNDSVKEIKGVGDKTSRLFSKLHITTISDLLFYFPRAFERYDIPKPLNQWENGKICVLNGSIRPGTIHTKKAGRYQLTTFTFVCENMPVMVTFFNMPFLSKVLKTNITYVFRGILKQNEHGYTMQQPQYFSPEEYEKKQGILLPVYGLTKGLSNKTIQHCLTSVFENISLQSDYLPYDILKENQLMALEDALYQVHFPKTENAYFFAKKRLALHEFFAFLIQMRANKEYLSEDNIENPLIATADTARFVEALPFSLTNAQMSAWKEIEDDLQKSVPMNRLLQGDVGSGKTIIAFLALLMAVSNNRQGCMMAPTEVLAQQHYESILAYTKKYGLCFRPVLLLGSMTAKQKREAKEGILNGTYNVIIGTHALIQDNVEYKNLSLVITDEQHRFGVKQREKLAKKGEGVHVLVMSATPIPRTLALILYGDLSITTMRELPKNRLPIKNCVVNHSFREKSYEFILKEIQKGHQIYVICPMVEACETMESLENVIDYTEKLKNIFPQKVNIAYLHGKMSMTEKNNIMTAFSNKDIDILVSTTVIEVGINVPNATVMMVENAERFGLAQLHQLRGRVGRGDAQSYCIFMSASDSEKNKKRLEVLNTSNDGFEIAEKDLELRGPGELTGYRQSGDLGFLIADLYEDSDMLRLADRLTTFFLQSNNRKTLSSIQSKMEYYNNLNPVDFRTI